MPYCVVKSCKNNNIGKVNTGLSFHKFPRDPFLRDKWTQIIRKTKKNDNWTPSDYCVICSAHFEDEDLYSAKTGLRRLRNDAIPTKNIFKNSNIKREHKSLDATPAKTKSTRGKSKKFADVSVKIENDSSTDSDEPLRSPVDNSSELISEVTTKTQSNRKIVYFNATDKTMDTVNNSVHNSPSTLAATSTQHNNIITIYEDDPLSIKEEIKIEIDTDDEDITDNISTTPLQSNISIISIKHQPNKKKKDAENKQKNTGKKKKKVEEEEEQNLVLDLKKDYVRMGPTVYRLQKDVTRLQQLRIKYKKKLKTQQQQIRRLNKRNASLKAKIRSITGSTSGRDKEAGSNEMPRVDDASDNESMTS